jgi:putative ABC transport system permease protein
MSDVKHALRRLVRSPGLLTAACVSLALGIGANTAAFSVVYAVLLRSLPVEDPSSLALVSAGSTSFQYSMSYPAYTYLRDHTSTIDGLIAFRAQLLNVSAGGATERVSGMLVSGNYFDVLGVTMTSGSPIRPEDDEAAGSGGRRGLVAVVSYDYWQRRLNGDAAAVGSTVRVNGYPATIVGIAPEGFRGTRVGSLPDVFVPMMFATRVFTDYPNWLTNPQNNWTRLIARVRAGASPPQAQADLTAAFRQFNRSIILPLTTNDRARQNVSARTIRLEAGQAGLMEMRNVKPTLFALMGLVGVVLLIACVNVANLMVARAERLHRQTAIAIALGATRARLWCQSVIDSAIISAGGVALGLAIGVWMRDVLLQLVPARQELDVTMDMQVFGASVAAGVFTTAAVAFVTARHTVRVGVAGALKSTDLPPRLWLRKGLIVAQLALSVLVLVAASLFTRTLGSLRAVDPGFDREHVLIASTATDGYSPERREAFYARVLQEVRTIPGVVSAALANDEPLRAGTGWTVSVRPDPGEPPQQIDVSVGFVSADYFKTMGMPMVRGREFEERDRFGASTPVVVNERFARQYVPRGTEPIGTSFVGNGTMVFEIVGVVDNSASLGLRDLDRYMLYVPGGRGVLHVRSAVPPETLIGPVRSAVQRLDPQVPVYDVRTISEQIDLAIGREQTFATLSLTFSVLALVLSSIGLFGVMANAVSGRTKELGIRLALGARPSVLTRSVIGEAALLVGGGALIGGPSAWLMARTIRGLFFGIDINGWQSLAVPVVVLAVVAAVAVWVPARRASRVDPLIALRSE